MFVLIGKMSLINGLLRILPYHHDISAERKSSKDRKLRRISQENLFLSELDK
jgi:hypothetical protein